MNAFPYNIEPRSSPSWLVRLSIYLFIFAVQYAHADQFIICRFSAISLAADVIASAKCDSIVQTLSSNSHGLVSVDDEEV
jgi:nucleolar pre-ribosomal-associated protein 1